MRMYPAFTHPAFGGYKRAKPHADMGMSRAARAARAAHPLKNGGVLSVLCVGCKALRLPKALREGDPHNPENMPGGAEASLARLPGQPGATQYARVRLGDSEKAGDPTLNRKVHPGCKGKASNVSFPVGDNAWLMWDVGEEQDAKPHPLTLMVMSSGRRVGEADVEWVRVSALMLWLT